MLRMAVAGVVLAGLAVGLASHLQASQADPPAAAPAVSGASAGLTAYAPPPTPMPRVEARFQPASGEPAPALPDDGPGAGERAALRQETLEAWQAQRRTPCDLAAQHEALRMTTRYIRAKLQDEQHHGEAASGPRWRTAQDNALAPYLQGAPADGSISDQDFAAAALSATPQGAAMAAVMQAHALFAKPRFSRPSVCARS